MFSLPCEFRRDRFVIVHTPLGDWLKRAVPGRKLRDSLFVYLGLETGCFAVGLWEDRRHTQFRDVLNLGGSPTLFLEDALHIRRLLSNHALTGRDLAERMREGWSRRRHRQQNEGEALADKFAWDRRTRVREYVDARQTRTAGGMPAGRLA